MTSTVRAAVIAGGALGTLARWGLSQTPDVRHVPAGTLAANVLGAFLLGWALTRLGDRAADTRWTPLTAGALGAATTFSTFILEVAELFSVDPTAASGYLAITIILGLAAAMLGRRVAEPATP